MGVFLGVKIDAKGIRPENLAEQTYLIFTQTEPIMNFRRLGSSIFLFLMSLTALAQQQKPDTVDNFKVKVSQPARFYVSNGLDFAMLSTSINSRPGKSTYLTVPRFTALVNIGFIFNYDLSNRVGLMTGLGLRNIGFIEKEGDTTIKRRVYALGVPLGIKIGDLRNRNFIFLGGGIDIPLHYQEKVFEKRSDKHRTGDWFSERTPRVMPFVFAGYSFDPGITFKLQYYPGNFLNQDYEETNLSMSPLPYKPYTDYKVNLLILSLGIDIHYNQYKIQEKEYQEMKQERMKTRSM